MQASEILTYKLEGVFKTQAGETIKDAFLAYRTFGSPSNPSILYPTWYSGSIADNEWLISPNHKGLNPSNYFIIIVALFGNGQSSSPSNYEGVMPSTTIYDNVRAQYELVTKHLEIKHLKAVLGWSMGAAQSFQWGTSYPTFMDSIIPFCGAARTAHHNITFLRSLVLTLQLDPAFKDGKYKKDEQPQEGKRAFSAIYSGWGFSQTFYRQELFKHMGFETREKFLVEFWDELFLHKDANNLLHMLWTWINADITATPERSFTHTASTRSSTSAYEAALASISAKIVVMPCRHDLYFPPEDSEFEVKSIGENASLVVIESVWGHFSGGGVPENKIDTNFIDEEVGKCLE